MTPLKGVLLGAWLAALAVAACCGSYYLGAMDQQRFIVSSCNSYGKYALEGTWVLLCSTNNPELLMRAAEYVRI